MAQQICPRCGSANVQIEMYKEDAGSRTVTTTKSKYKEKGHGILWWIFIGSWWWFIDLLLWLCFFPLRFLMHLGRRKKYVGKSKTVSVTNNRTNYRSMCLCRDCGNSWDASRVAPAAFRNTPRVPLPDRNVDANKVVHIMNNPDCSYALISALAGKNSFTIPEVSMISNYDLNRSTNLANLLMSRGFVNREYVDGQNLYIWTNAARG